MECMIKNNNFSLEIDKKWLESIPDTSNANIELFITFENGVTVTIIVGTPKNFDYIMSKDKTNFYKPGLPWIIVKELTIEIIHEAIQAYMADRPNGYWLKVYHFWNEIDTSVFDSLESLELDESDQLNLITNSNKLLKLLENFNFNSEKLSLQLDQ